MTNKNKLNPAPKRFTNEQINVLERDSFLVEYTPKTLKLTRKHHGLTQSQLASQASISVDYCSELERGGKPSSQLCGRLRQALRFFSLIEQS